MTLGVLISRIWRFLTFRGLRVENAEQLNIFLIVGIMFTWVAGIGRYWDHPSATLWQYAGLGSVAYIFILAFIIWAIVYPIRRGPWTYKSVLTFIALTSPLAWLYAIPVERFMAVDAAITANILFLLIVAAWRVGLLVHFLKSYGRFSVDIVIITTLLPLTLIIGSLAVLNLEQGVFQIMAGLGDERTDTQRVHDDIYALITAMSVLSALAFPFLAIAYFLQVIKAWRGREKN